jgi:hypothetical protein
MSSRSKPYTTNQVSWKSILEKHLTIPMNQREYSWEQKQISKFLDDIFDIYKENKYVLKLGSIINLKQGNVNNIYDGQQRILTTILILIVIGSLVPTKLKEKITQLLAVDTEIDTLTEQQEKIKETFNVTIIPTIYCINPFDMEALIKIYNNNIKSHLEFVSNIKDFVLVDNNENKDEEDDKEEDNKEEEKYICKHCNTKIMSKNKFIEHLTNKHSDIYTKPTSNTKLYAAYIFIYNYFIKKNYNERQIIELYRFILFDIDIQYYDCTDPEYVSKIFDWENNRGKSVETLDIIKNPILVNIEDSKKVEVYEKWEKLKHKGNNIYKKDYGQKIFDIAISLYNKVIVRKIKHEELYKPIIDCKDKDTCYKEVNKFFKIVEKLFEIMDKITNDKYGRLINNTSRFRLNWEAYMWCLLPIFYIVNTIDKDLIKLLTTWYCRNIQFKTLTFNSLCYSDVFIKITNEVIKNSKFDYYKEINACLVKNKDRKITDESYKQELQTINLNSTNATHLLLFLETCINTDIHTVSLEYTLEHIFCQKDKTKLLDPLLINNIGNLTLLEGKNSANGHKGNNSLGSKAYTKKKLSYEKSSYMISRNTAKEYETFEEKDIVLRSQSIITELNKYTNY